jgi:hypothetical protein
MTTTTNNKNKWSAQDRQAFADRNILKAQRIPNKKKQQNKKACRIRLAGY